MTRYIYLSICVLLLGSTGYAQYHEMMRTLRPGVTVAPWAVGENTFQAHIGAENGWYQTNDDRTNIYSRYLSGNAALCYGITHKFELDGIINVRHDKYDINNVSSEASGVNIGALGARYTIYNGGIGGMSVGLQGLVKIPDLSDDYSATKVAPRILALLGYDASEYIYLTANLGFEYDGVTDNPQGLYSLKSNFMLSPALGSFLELYGTVKHSTLYNRVNLGLYYYITNGFTVDAYAGMGDDLVRTHEGFIGLGLSFRFSTMRKRQGWVYGEYRY